MSSTSIRIRFSVCNHCHTPKNLTSNITIYISLERERLDLSKLFFSFLILSIILFNIILTSFFFFPFSFSFFFFVFFETGFLYVVLAVLELTVQTKLAS